MSKIFRKRKVTFKQELVDSKTILSLRHVKQFFDLGEGIKTKAVHDVSFDIKEGECFGLVGESGCGKTTTGRSIIRLYDITSGSIYFKGYRISAGSRWNKKEIKWSRIHAKNQIKLLKAEKKSPNPSSVNPDELFPQIARLKKAYALKRQELAIEKHDEFEDVNDLSKEENDAAIAELNKKYDIRLELLNEEEKRSLEKLRTSLVGSSPVATPESKESIDEEIKTIRKNELEHIIDQYDKILQHNYDNHHVDTKLTHEIQMIFQDPVDSLDPRMTVEDIIEEGLHIQHKNNKIENQKTVAEVLKKVGLIPEYASRYPHEFSGGQRQRIGIARALVMNPKFLICDEPISALDVSIRAQILNLLNDVKGEMGLTILFIAHDLSVVKYFCDRIAVMYFGNLVELASSDELFKHPLHPYTRALLSAIPKPDPLSEKNRVRKVYNPATDHDYSVFRPSFREIIPGHFVLCNDPEEKRYLEEIAAIDKGGGETPKKESKKKD